MDNSVFMCKNDYANCRKSCRKLGLSDNFTREYFIFLLFIFCHCERNKILVIKIYIIISIAQIFI